MQCTQFHTHTIAQNENSIYRSLTLLSKAHSAGLVVFVTGVSYATRVKTIELELRMAATACLARCGDIWVEPMLLFMDYFCWF